MSDHCPYIEECKVVVKESYYNLVCTSKITGWVNCHKYEERHPELRKTPSAWAKETKSDE